MIYDSILNTVGQTPLVRLKKLAQGLPVEVVAKVEFFNPGSSVKDRIAVKIITEAERRGELRPGATIIEATSGNTGMGLALVAAVKGYKSIFVMPDKMSQEKIQALRAFGSRVVITPTNVEPEDPRSYYSVALRLAKETPHAFYANQYHNPDNPKAHYEMTGPELWEQTEGRITAFIGGIGTGGTVSGVGRFLKEKNPQIQVIAADPEGSLYAEYKQTGRMGAVHPYKVEGIGEDFMPSTIDFSVIDEVIQISDKESFQWTRRLARQEGIFVGGSCGTALAAALTWSRRQKPGGLAVVLLPDSGSRYLSKVFNDDWLRECGFSDEADTLVKDVFKASRVITSRVGDLAKDCIAHFKETGVSQMPVLDEKGKLYGIITEYDLLSAALGGSANLSKPIDPFVVRPVATVSLQDPLSKVQDLLKVDKVPVVVDADSVLGVVTKIDLLDFYSQRGTGLI